MPSATFVRVVYHNCKQQRQVHCGSFTAVGLLLQQSLYTSLLIGLTIPLQNRMLKQVFSFTGLSKYVTFWFHVSHLHWENYQLTYNILNLSSGLFMKTRYSVSFLLAAVCTDLGVNRCGLCTFATYGTEPRMQIMWIQQRARHIRREMGHRVTYIFMYIRPYVLGMRARLS